MNHAEFLDLISNPIDCGETDYTDICAFCMFHFSVDCPLYPRLWK